MEINGAYIIEKLNINTYFYFCTDYNNIIC